MFEVIIALFFTAMLLILVRMAKGAMLTPVPLGREQSLSLTLRVGDGASENLEMTVDALRWLRSSGTLPWTTLTIEDGGMDAETAAVAGRLADKDGSIGLHNLHTEDKWVQSGKFSGKYYP